MRHSEKMFDKVYSHMDKTQIKQLMKKQIYNTEELTEEQKNKYDKQIDDLKKMFLESTKQSERAITHLENIESNGLDEVKELKERIKKLEQKKKTN